MTQFKSNSLTAAIAAAIFAGALASQPACADHEGSYLHPTSYSLKLTHMPDFDQRRVEGMGQLGLPGDGSMYCVPTATMNLMAYAANHGFPNLAPGPAWWQSQARYNDATTNIAIMGGLMGTSANGGTNGNGLSFGTGLWLAGGGGHLTRSTILASGSSCPTITHIAQSVATGGITTLSYGRYVYIGNVSGIDFVGARTGGHCVTFSEASRNGSDIVIKVRDPADDPDWAESGAHLFSQSGFADKVFSTASQRTVSNFNWQRTMTSIIYPPPVPDEGTWLIRLIDKYQVVRPKWGFTWQPGINNNPPSFNFNFPPLGGSNQESHNIINLSGLADVIDVSMTADNINAYVIGSSAVAGPTLQLVELPTGDMTVLTPVPGALGMAVGRKQEIYVLTEEAVLCIDPFNAEQPVQAEVNPPDPVKAICYDDVNDHVHVINPDGGRIHTYAHRFEDDAMPIMTTCIPALIPLEPDEAAMAVNPVDGKVWFLTPASNTIYHVPFDPACEPVVEMMSVPGLMNPRSLSFDDHGHAFVAHDGGLMELMFNMELERWEQVENPYFNFGDMHIGEEFYVTRSRTNYDPKEHGGPDWFNVDPEEERLLEGATVEVDCLADLVTSKTFQPPPDGIVDGADLAFLLGAWGDAMDSPADIVTSATFAPPEDGRVDGADLAFLLGAWGECE